MSEQPPVWNAPESPVSPSIPPPPPGRRPATPWIAVAVAAVLGIAAAVTTVLMLNRSAPAAAAEPVSLESMAVPGDDPFLASAQVTEVTALPDPVRAVAASTAAGMTADSGTGTLSAAGTVDNLYGGVQGDSTQPFGGSGSSGDCDLEQLAAYLAGNPEKARAWAAVRGIDPAQIPVYLNTLTPVVLLHDTLVTNHGFSNGVATPRQSVLQAGTGVLVDATGQPVVRCACGNPLTAPTLANLSAAAVLGTRWDNYDPARTVLVTGGGTAAGFVLVDVLTGQSFTRPAGVVVPAPTTTAAPPVSTVTVSAPTTSGPECAFDLQQRGDGIFGDRAWAEASAAGTYNCAEMIARWRMYEAWTGPVSGQVGRAELGDGWACSTSWVPLSTPEYVDGSVGRCDNGDVSAFTIWYGEYGEHKIPPATAPPAPAPGPAAPDAGGCSQTVPSGEGRWDFVNGGWMGIENSAMSCQQMIDKWADVRANSLWGGNSADGWYCAVPSAGDYGGCYHTGQGLAFSVFPSANGSAQGGGSPQGGDTGGAATADLGLPVPMTRPVCDGTGIVLLFASVTPGAYAAEVQQALDQYPGASYLRTDQSCSSLNQSTNAGDPIYAVYRPISTDQTAVCAAVTNAGPPAYGKWLDNSTDPDSRITC